VGSVFEPFCLASLRTYAAPPRTLARPRQQPALPWHPQIQGAIASPTVALHKTKESQVRAKRKTYPQEGRQVPLEKFLKISRPAAAMKKSLAKYFSLSSQFIGSLSLDLLHFRSSPFWASITRAIKEGIGLGCSSSQT